MQLITPDFRADLLEQIQREFIYYPPGQLLICQVCEQVVWKDEVREHIYSKKVSPLSNSHGSFKRHAYTKEDIESVLQIISSLYASARSAPAEKGLSLSDLTGYPVPYPLPGLTTYHDGLQCPYSSCKYVLRTEGSMRTHMSTCSQKPSTSLANSKPTSVYCQRLFPTRAFHGYFAVPKPTETPAKTTDIRMETFNAGLKTAAVLLEEEKVYIGAIPKDQITPFEARAGFHTLFLGLGRNSLQDATRPVSVQHIQTRDGHDAILASACARLMIELGRGVRQHTSTMIRQEMISNGHQETFGKVFRIPTDKTLYQYGSVLGRILIFFLRTIDDQQYNLCYSFNSEQVGAWKGLISVISTQLSEEDIDFEYEDELVDDSEEDFEVEEEENRSMFMTSENTSKQCGFLVECNQLTSALLNFLFTLFTQRIEVQESESPLIVATSALGVMGLGWLPPGRFSQHLSAVICFGNLLFLQVAGHLALQDVGISPNGGPIFAYPGIWDQKTNGNSINVIGRLQQVRQVLGSDGRNTPYRWALDLRSYAKKVHLNEGSVPRLQWVDEDRLILDDNLSIHTVQFQNAVREHVHRLGEMLDGLVFGQKLPPVDWENIGADRVDGVDRQSLTWLFPPSDASWLLKHIAESSSPTFIDADGHIIEHVVLDYLRRVDAFLLQLLGVVHLTYGQPGRGTELLTVRHLGLHQPRNIRLYKGYLCLTIQYSKTGWRPIARFLPRCVGEVLLQYLRFVEPCVRALSGTMRLLAGQQGQAYIHWRPNGYLWPDSVDFGQHTFTSSRLSHWLRTNFAQSLPQKPKITIASYRQIVTAISRRFLLNCIVDSPDEEEGDGTEPKEVAESEVEILLQRLRGRLQDQAGHSEEVSNGWYARPYHALLPTGGGGNTEAAYLQASQSWHRWLGLEGTSSPSTSSRGLAQQARRRAALQRVDPAEAFIGLYGPGAQLYPGQARALHHIFQGCRAVTAVLPTGGGKSVLFMLPAFTGHGGLSLVIVPHISLEQDLAARSHALQLSAVIWTDQTSRHAATEASLVFITPEATRSNLFRSWLEEMNEAGHLDRIVIDEAHEPFSSFRKDFRQLGGLLSHRVQTICLSATLTPDDEQRLWHSLDRSSISAVSIREPTVQRNLRFLRTTLGSVGWRLKEDQHVLAAHCARWIQWFRVSEMRQRTGQQPQTIGVFVENVEAAEAIAGHLDCPVIHARLDRKVRAERTRGLCSGDTSLVVFTSAAAQGMDVPFMGLLLVLGCPASLRLFVQVAGRCARKLTYGTVLLLTGKGIDWGRLDDGMIALRDTSGCVRRVLDRFDGRTNRASCETGEEECGNCDAARSALLLDVPPIPEGSSLPSTDPTALPFTSDLDLTVLFDALPVTCNASHTSSESSHLTRYSSPDVPPPWKRRRIESSPPLPSVDNLLAREAQRTRRLDTAAIESQALASDYCHHVERILTDLSTFCVICGKRGHIAEGCTGVGATLCTVRARVQRYAFEKGKQMLCYSCQGPCSLCQRWIRARESGVWVSKSKCSPMKGIFTTFFYLWSSLRTTDLNDDQARHVEGMFLSDQVGEHAHTAVQLCSPWPLSGAPIRIVTFHAYVVSMVRWIEHEIGSPCSAWPTTLTSGLRPLLAPGGRLHGLRWTPPELGTTL